MTAGYLNGNPAEDPDVGEIIRAEYFPLVRAGDFTAAFKCAQRMYKRWPKKWAVLRVRAHATELLGDQETLLKACEDILAARPDDPWARERCRKACEAIVIKRKSEGWEGYENHCWHCRSYISSAICRRCPKCRLFHCRTCGACLCGPRASWARVDFGLD